MVVASFNFSCYKVPFYFDCHFSWTDLVWNGHLFSRAPFKVSFSGSFSTKLFCVVQQALSILLLSQPLRSSIYKELVRSKNSLDKLKALLGHWQKMVKSRTKCLSFLRWAVTVASAVNDAKPSKPVQSCSTPLSSFLGKKLYGLSPNSFSSF